MSNGSDNPPPIDPADKLAAVQQRAAELKALQDQLSRDVAAAEAEATNAIAQQEAERLRARERAQATRLKEQAQARAARKRARAAAAAEAADAPPVIATATQPIASSAPARGRQMEDASVVAVEDDPMVDATDDEYEYGDGEFIREPIDETQAETGKRRKRIGLYCFNCNRPEGHFLTYYRKMAYSYVIGMTFGLAIIFGPYRCQCCGSNRLMLSNLLNPRYYFAMMSTKSSSRKRGSSRR